MYRVTCTSINSLPTNLTADNRTFTVLLNNLPPYTTYTCCVEALYTDNEANSDECVLVTTPEGRKSFKIL